MKRAVHHLWCLALLFCVGFSTASQLPNPAPVTTPVALSKEALFFRETLMPQLEKLVESIAQSAICLIPQKNGAQTQILVGYLAGLEQIANIDLEKIDNEFISIILHVTNGISQDMLAGLKNDFIQFPPFDPKRYLEGNAKLGLEQQIAIAQHIAVVIDELAKHVNEKVQDVLAESVVTIKSQITTLDFTLQKIAGVVNSSNHVNKGSLRENLMELRSILQMIQQQIITSPASIQLLNVAHTITRAIINQLNACTKNKFKALDKIELDKYLTRKPEDSLLGLEELKVQMALTSNELAQLQKNTEKANLTYVNRLARAFDDYVVVPAQKYKLPTRIGAGLAVGGMATFLWYYFDQHAYADAIPGFRSFFGWRSRIKSKEITYQRDANNNLVLDAKLNPVITKVVEIQDPEKPING